MTGDASPQSRRDPGASRCVLGVVGGDQVAAVAGRPAQRVQTGVVLALDPNQRGSAGVDDAGEEVDRAPGAARNGHSTAGGAPAGWWPRDHPASAARVEPSGRGGGHGGDPRGECTQLGGRALDRDHVVLGESQDRAAVLASAYPVLSGGEDLTLVSAAASHSMCALIGSPRRGGRVGVRRLLGHGASFGWAGGGPDSGSQPATGGTALVGAQAGASAVQARRLMRSGSSLVSTRVARAAASSPLARTGA